MAAVLVRGLYNIKPAMQGGVVTIGNFDGVHLGHQALLGKVVSEARRRGVPSIAITFEPHPFEFFAKDNTTVPRITRLREKFPAIAACGIDYVVVLKFNQELASLSAGDFARILLQNFLKPAAMIIGDDFRFGKGRSGDFDLLKTVGDAVGFTVEAMPTYLYEGERVSSTRLRKVLGEADQALAARLMGHPYFMQGRVRGGDQLGRQWGFPTANIHLHRKLTPIRGIYTVYMHGIADKPLPGVANVGTRPTVDGTRTILEVHLLNFNQDIYGRYVQVEFCKKIREEERYPSIALLIDQIAKDVETAKAYFQEQGVI